MKALIEKPVRQERQAQEKHLTDENPDIIVG